MQLIKKENCRICRKLFSFFPQKEQRETNADSNNKRDKAAHATANTKRDENKINTL